MANWLKLSLILVVLVHGNRSFSASELSPTEIEKKLLVKKFEGYAKFVKDKKNYEKLRKKNVEQHKLKRKRYEEQRKKSRALFIKKKKSQKKKSVDIDAIVAKQQNKREKNRNKKRLKFIKRKKLMQQILRNSPRIPDDVDVGLKDYDSL